MDLTQLLVADPEAVLDKRLHLSRDLLLFRLDELVVIHLHLFDLGVLLGCRHLHSFFAIISGLGFLDSLVHTRVTRLLR